MNSRFGRGARLVVSCCALALLWFGSGGEAVADTSIVAIGSSLPDGPYTSLYVDRSDPTRFAVGTADGHIAWSYDGAERVVESRVHSPRNYDAMAIRGAAKNSSLGSQAAGAKTQRAVRLFIRTLGTGKGIVRWHFWRSVTAPLTDITAIALPSPGGNMLVASSAGISVSDKYGGAWTKTLGAPGTMPREDVDLVALSVIANPSNPSIVLAGTTKGVFLSRDGGMNFTPHSDAQITEELVFDFLWDAVEPSVVLAIGPDTIFQSEDGGEHFQLAFVSPAEINQVVTSDRGVFIATTKGLTLVDGSESPPLISGESILGVAPWIDGGILALTSKSLYLIDEYGVRTTIVETPEADPFVRLDGAPGLAYILTMNEVFRVGAPIERHRAPRVPVLSMSMSAVQQAMLDNLGLGKPADTRLHIRWYAKLLPHVAFDAMAVKGGSSNLMTDYTLPVDFRFAKAQSYSNIEFSVMATWDLSNLVFGNTTVANPDLFIESTLRGNRQRILGEVRSQYRKAAVLARRLRTPPDDPEVAFLWRMRLDEHVSYLEFVSGKTVVKEQQIR